MCDLKRSEKFVMSAFKTHFIHVGNMNNKGTQALFSSDVAIIKEISPDASVSVSTPDIVGVQKLGLPLSHILPPMVDIPYDKADQICKSRGHGRSGFYYKGLTMAILLLMPVQTVFSLFSVLLSRAGLRPLYRGEVVEQFKNSDLVISHSDENFKETASQLPLNPYWALTWWSMLISRTLDIMVARSLGKSVVLFPNSVGPFRTWLGRFLVRLSLNNCDYLLIRDPISYNIVNQLGIRSSKLLTYDTALLFTDASPLPSSPVDVPRPVIGVSAGIYSNSLSKFEVLNYIESHADALDDAIEKFGVRVAFLPHYISGFSNDDLDVSNRILERMDRQDQACIITAEGVPEFKYLLNQMDLVISSKMHPAILAATAYVPVLCIVYDHKQTGFFQRLDMAQCTLDISEVSHEALFAKLDQTWSHKDALRQSLSVRIPQWQRGVSGAIKAVVNLYVNRRE
jgi:polysaccharide pyruvyl transferase WcaK-like protein